jgi:hypothetical protein
VTTNRDTDYSHGNKCSDISNGDTLSINGTTQTDGTVLATAIEITKNEK